MIVTKVYKRVKQKIYPNKEQKMLINQTFGSCRKVWNLMLSDYNDTGVLNEVSSYKKEYLYLKDVDSLALSNEKVNLRKAIKQAKTGKKGEPHFKQKFKKQSYTTNMVNDNIKLLKK